MHESTYISQTDIAYRKERGQFFTPPSVARLMMRWILQNQPKTILDPAFGLGIFYDELCKLDLMHQPAFVGYEIDDRILSYLDHKANRANFKIITQDYLESDHHLFDAIICNPPYMRFQKFLKRHDILPQIEEKFGIRLTGYANLSSVFLIKALNELKHGGRLAFIMPFEFFNAGYGTEIKKKLLENYLLKQIITFTNEKDIFPDATTTICLLLCQNDNQNNAIKITSIRTNEEVNKISDLSSHYQHKISSKDLPYNQKWSPIISSLITENLIPQGFCKVSFYGHFKRGIATGANDFFALSKSDIEKYNLGQNNICHCITKSPQIKYPVFSEKDFNALVNQDKPVYCLDIKDHNQPEVIAYLQQGEKLGYHQRYLTKHRNPWYKIEKREPAPILFGVFNRGQLKVIRNFTNSTNFTCFHCFYPNLIGSNYINQLFVYFLSSKGQSLVKMNKRSYGNNLDKLEPGDLNDCFCPNPEQFNLILDSDTQSVIAIAQTDVTQAINMSDQLIKRIL